MRTHALFRCAAIVSALLLAALPARQATAADSYTMADFERVPKIDAHLHLHGADQRAFLALARRLNARALTINVDYPDFPPLERQQRGAAALHRDHSDTVGFVASFAPDGFEQAGWNARTMAGIDAALAAGAVGVKVWKNIGMQLRDAQKRLVMIDDARFDSLFDVLERRGVLVLGHQGEPHNCWLPLEQMSVKNDREYFRNHPQYHMYLHPEMPSYAQQMAARDRWLAKHPSLPFVGVHMASLEWSVDELGRFLDRNPRASVDVAARIGQLQHQSQRDRERVRRFFIRYQDRLIYGSDLAQPEEPDERFVRELEAVWRRDWRYFNTDERFTVPELDGEVHGLALPKQVADKLFRLNAERVFTGAWKKPAA